MRRSSVISKAAPRAATIAAAARSENQKPKTPSSRVVSV
jgi:hypothetical protein